MKSVFVKSIAASTLLCAASLSLAGEYYGSANLIRSEVDLDISGMDDADTSFSIAGGYKFNENVAFELGYIDFGEAKASGRGSASWDADAIEISVAGLLPLSAQGGLYTRLGLDFWDSTFRYSSVPFFGSGKASDDGTDLFYGLGGYVNLGSNVNVHLEYQFHELDDVDVDTLLLGMSFYF